MPKCAFKIFPKIRKKIFLRAPKIPGSPKKFLGKVWRVFEQIPKNFVFYPISWYFACSLLHGKEQKIAYFTIFLAYFTLLFTKKLRTKYQEAAQNPKFFRFCSKIIQTFPRIFLGTPKIRTESPRRFFRRPMCAKIRSILISVSKVAENTRELKQNVKMYFRMFFQKSKKN